MTPADPTEALCRCGRVGSFGLGKDWFCLDHLPAPWQMIAPMKTDLAAVMAEHAIREPDFFL